MNTSKFVRLDNTTEGPLLPIEVDSHCMALIGENRVMILGGDLILKTYLYEIIKQEWSNGPNLLEDKIDDCASGIAIDSVTGENIVIAASEWYSGHVEFWIENWDTWIKGQAVSNH